MKNTARFIAAVLVFALCLSCIPVRNIYADTENRIDVTTDGTKIYQKASISSKVIDTCKQDSVLTYIKKVKAPTSGFSFLSVFTKRIASTKANEFYQVTYEKDNMCKTGYISTMDAKEHVHDNRPVETSLGTYYVCETCGNVSVKTKTGLSSKEKTQATAVLSMARSVAPQMGIAVSLDGPAPFGDVVAGVIFLGAILKITTMPTTTMTTITNADFMEDMKDKTSCSQKDVYYPAVRSGDLLKVDTSACMSYGEAYVYIALGNGNIYTEKQSDAKTLALAFSKDSYCERNSGRPDYFYHYHIKNIYGKKIDGETHIFFGKTQEGNRSPIGLDSGGVFIQPNGCRN